MRRPRLRPRTFSATLLALMTLTCVVAVALASGVTAVVEVLEEQEAGVHSLATQAELLAANCGAAIVFGDEEAATQTLRSLRVEPQIIHAHLFAADGRLFASYHADERRNYHEADFVQDWMPGERISGFSAVLARQVVVDDQAVGMLVLGGDMTSVYVGIGQRLLVSMAAAALACGAALVLGLRFRRVLARPIEELVAAAHHVGKTNDYRVSARKFRDDELGDLTDAFNQMLAQIRVQSEQLEASHQQLEQRVRERTRELEVATDQARAASAAKTRFLANMSHEIRTPMTAILGFGELLLDPSLNETERQDYVQTLRQSGEHLLAVINDILDVTKIESGRMSVERLTTPLLDVVAEALGTTRQAAHDKRLDLRVDLRAPLPRSISTDPVRLRQILINLLGNAIKFTDRGSVCLRVCMESQRIRFDVVDTGIGITQEQAGRIFKAFTQADETTTRRFGGTGLGLTISRQLAQLLGGDVTLESKPGRGSTFTLTIDPGDLSAVEFHQQFEETAVHALAAPAPKPAPVHRHCSARVLLAEDGPDNTRILVRILEKAGVTVTHAADGQAAFDAAIKAAAKGAGFDVILMDMQMPVLDGYAATRALRQAGYTAPIVALTAHAMAEDRQRCLEAGCDDYLTKPVNREKLLETVGRYARPTQAPPPVAAPPPPAAAPIAQPTRRLVSRFAADPDLADLVEAFVAELPQRVQEIRAAVERDDRAMLARLSHQLKGAAGTHGLPEITDAARNLEKALRDSADIDAVRAKMGELIQLCEDAGGRGEVVDGSATDRPRR